MAEHDELENDVEPEADADREIEEALETALELDTQSQVFLEMRKQNLDLLKLAIEMVGFGGQHPPVKHGDIKSALRSVWDVYSEFYAWVDPEESEGDDEEDEDEL